MVEISCTRANFSGTVILPASKSISNRLLIMQEISGGRLQINNMSNADDTLLMQQCLSRYRQHDHLFTDNAGTVMRFMTALLAVSKGKWWLEGSPRMNQRPIGPLVEALQQLGANIQYTGAAGYPPLLIEGHPLEGGTVTIDASTSSQFISAILMVAPRFKQPLRLELSGTVASEPYIDMTLSLMKACNIPLRRHGNIITVSPSPYEPASFNIESDWSSAAFFYALSALSESAGLLLSRLSGQSLQGDSILQEWFEPLGVSTSFRTDGAFLEKTKVSTTHLELDFSSHPDIFLPVAVACAGNGIRFSAKGLQNLTHKESDRLLAAAKTLTESGFEVYHSKKDFVLEPGQPWTCSRVIPTIAVQGDHRMAMSFALLAARFPFVKLDEPDVVSKSFPGFFEILKSLGFRILRSPDRS